MGREGGTWLGIGTKGGVIKLGALLNLTGEAKHRDAQGRGFLVANYIGGNQTNDEYTNQLIHTEEKFNAYNLVTIEIR